MGAIRVRAYDGGREPEPVPHADDTEAFERFYADYSAQVRRMVRRYLSNGIVDDIVQEAFMQAYRSGLHLQRQAEGDLATWKRLVGIARNRSIDVLRRRVRRVEEVPAEERLEAVPATPYADPELQLQATRRRAGIAEALDALCERQRRVLFLKDVDGLKYDEIAALEGISIDAVKATLARGRRAFREAYASIAERDGLRVLVGARLLAQLRSRLRALRDRAASGVGDALSSVATASAAVSHAMVTAVVVGSIAVVGAGTAAASEGQQAEPVAHTSDAPADEPEHGNDEDGGSPASQGDGAEEQGDGQEDGADASGEPEPGSPSDDDGGSRHSHHTEASTGADTGDVADPGPAGAEASAGTSGDTAVDTEKKQASHKSDGEADSDVESWNADGSADGDVEAEAEAGCQEPEHELTAPGGVTLLVDDPVCALEPPPEPSAP